MELFGILGQKMDRFFSLGRYFPNTSSTFLNQLIGTKNPIWIDPSVGKLWDIYQGVPHLYVIIGKIAQLFSLGKFQLKDAKGKIITDHVVLTLLADPNPLQSTAEFLAQYMVFKHVYANTFFYQLRGLSAAVQPVPSALWNLPPSLMKINPTGKIFNQTKIEDIIKNFTMRYQGADITYEPADIIFKNSNLSSEYLKSTSDIVAMVKPLSNLEAALQTINKLTKDHGAFGMISNQTKDEQGGMPMDPAERKRIENELMKRYGNRDDQSAIIVTDASATFTPMTFSMKDMMLIEQNEEAFGILLANWNVDRDVFPSTKGATRENKREGLIATLQDAVMPEADDICQAFTKAFRLTEQGLTLTMSFDHLPVMQWVKMRDEQAQAAKVTSLHTQLADGVLLQNEYRAALGRDELPPKSREETLNERIANNQAELRGTVGGTTAILELNASVATGETDREAAIQIMINQYGYEQSVAESMITRTVRIPEPKNPKPAFADAN